jgi:RNA polymerase sigma-70 factor, ECF subfamily
MPPSDDLRELIRRAQARDPSAISELYGHYAGLVLRYLLVRVAEPELAQDLTQEVFIKIIGGIERFEYRDEKAFLGWIYTIAANTLHSYQRRRRVVAAPFDDRHELIDQRSYDHVRQVTERIDLQQAFGQLTRDQQQVLTLRFFADMSNSEVAGLLRRTEGAVKAIQHRALQSLQKIMGREPDEQPAPAPGRRPTHSGTSSERALRERELGRTISLSELASPAPCDAPAGD